MYQYVVFLLLIVFNYSVIASIKTNNHFTTIKRKLTSIASSLVILSNTFNNQYNHIQPAFADDLVLKEYSNQRYHTTLKYPTDWEEKIGSLSGDRTVIAFTNPKDIDTSVSIVFTPIPADYTKLNSFGGKETIRQYLLPTGDGITTNLIDEHVKGESYYIEYVVGSPELPTRHVSCVFALRPQEAIVGLTIQTKEDTYQQFKDAFDAILPTFQVDIN